MTNKILKLSPNDLADNSNEPKVLKLQDIDIWTKDELELMKIWDEICEEKQDKVP